MPSALGLPVSAGFAPQNLDAPVPNAVASQKASAPPAAFRVHSRQKSAKSRRSKSGRSVKAMKGSR